MTGPIVSADLRILEPRSVDGAPEPAARGQAGIGPDDPGLLMRTCANCGAEMDERKCKLICRCGYFLSCSDYY